MWITDLFDVYKESCKFHINILFGSVVIIFRTLQFSVKVSTKSKFWNCVVFRVIYDKAIFYYLLHNLHEYNFKMQFKMSKTPVDNVKFTWFQILVVM